MVVVIDLTMEVVVVVNVYDSLVVAIEADNFAVVFGYSCLGYNLTVDCISVDVDVEFDCFDRFGRVLVDTHLLIVDFVAITFENLNAHFDS